MADAGAESVQPEIATPVAHAPPVKLTLDEARDYLYTAWRSIERFAAELKTTVDTLQARKPGEEWLELTETQMTKGVNFLHQQMEAWSEQAERMDAYMASVRALADEMALKELQLNGQAGDETKPGENDARFIHPELRRFKLEKTAKIIGKYGGSPALGAMVMPRLMKESILKATGSPAAREISYSKSENKEASELAQVMRFKAEKKEKGLAAWQDELVGRKGAAYLEEQQKKGVAPDAPKTLTPIPTDLRNALAQRQAAVEAHEAQEAAAANKVAAKPSTPSMTGELADRLQRRQQAAAEQAAAEAAEAATAAKLAKAAAAAASSVDTSSGVTPLTAELSKAILRRNATRSSGGAGPSSSGAGGTSAGPAKETESNSVTSTPAPMTSLRPAARTPQTPPSAMGSTTSGGTSELLAKFQKMRQDNE